MAARIGARMKINAWVAAILTMAAAGSAGAQDLPAGVDELLRCREVTDDAERLRCFEEKSDALAGALERREVVAADRQEVQEAKRQLFGFSLPDLNMFDGGEAGEDEDDVDSVEGTVASVSQDANSRWVLTLESGQVWRQSDSRAIVRPRPGQPVTIRRASMGSFMMRVNNQPGIRVQRSR